MRCQAKPVAKPPASIRGKGLMSSALASIRLREEAQLISARPSQLITWKTSHKHNKRGKALSSFLHSDKRPLKG